MPKPMFAAVLAIAFLPPSAAGVPYPERPGPAPPAEPVRPCLVDSLSCLRLSPRPFQPCLAALKRCGDHFSLIPIAGNPRFMPAEWSGAGKTRRQPER